MERFIHLIALLFIGVLIVASCTTQKTADTSEMLKDEERKEQIFSAILNDNEMRTELMNRMMEEGNSPGMMEHMMQAAEGDTATCRMMSSMMMENPHMMDMMMGSMMDKAEGDDAMCKKMCMMMMDSDKMKGMMQQMNGQEQPTGNSKGKERKHMETHFGEQHPQKSKNK